MKLKISILLAGFLLYSNSFAQNVKIIKHKVYNQVLIGNNLEADIITDPRLIKTCMHCGDFPINGTGFIKTNKKIKKYKKEEPVNCSIKIVHQIPLKFKKFRKFEAEKNLFIYKEPVNCSSVKTNKILKKGTDFISDKYSKFGWIKIKKSGWVKGYLLNPKIIYKPKLKKVSCPICEDWLKN